MEPLRIALIGCGEMVYNLIYDCVKRLPVRLIAICDEEEEKLSRFTATYSVPKSYQRYQDMLAEEKPDAVIAFPNGISSHYTIVKDCLLAGANIFIERPQCLTSEQAKELIGIQRERTVYAVARLNKRFAPGYMMAKDIVSKTEFGPITMYGAKYQASEYDSEPGFILKHIIHHLDLARYLLGELVITHVDSIIHSKTRIGYNISFIAAGGAIGVIQSGSLQGSGYPMERVEITGVGRNVVVDNIRSVEYNRPARKRNADTVEPLSDGGDTLVWNLNHGNNSTYTFHGFENQLHHFVHSLLQKKEPSPHLEDSIRTIELVEQLLSLTKNRQGDELSKA